MKDPTLLLKTYLEEEIVIVCKESKRIPCILHAFDEHLNVLVTREDEEGRRKALFIRGETISRIEKKKLWC